MTHHHHPTISLSDGKNIRAMDWSMIFERHALDLKEVRRFPTKGKHLAKQSIVFDTFNGWKAIIDVNGIAMVFGETTIGLDGIVMVFNCRH